MIANALFGMRVLPVLKGPNIMEGNMAGPDTPSSLYWLNPQGRVSWIIPEELKCLFCPLLDDGVKALEPLIETTSPDVPHCVTARPSLAHELSEPLDEAVDGLKLLAASGSYVLICLAFKPLPFGSPKPCLVQAAL